MRNVVFISYSSIDEDFAEDVAQILEDIGIEYFLDSKDIDWGDHIVKEVQEGLSNCSTIVVIISPASLKSQWVLFELGYAMGRGKDVLPLLMHPSLDVPGYLQAVHYETSLEGAKDYFKKYIDRFKEKEPSGVELWLTTTKKDVKVGLLTPKDKEIVHNTIIGSIGYITGLPDNSQFFIQAFMTTDIDYPQGASFIDEDGYWEIKKIHLGGTDHNLFYRIFDKSGQYFAESNRITVFRIGV